MERRTIALVEAVFAVVVWGASFIATKVALADASPIVVVWVRFAIGVAVLLVAAVVRRQVAAVGGRDLATFALLGALGITFHQWLQSNGLVTSQATTSAWIVAATPVFIAILSAIALRERLSFARAVGIALASLGVAVVVTRGHPASLLSGRFGAPGDLLVLISSPNWAVFSVLSRRVLARHPAARVMAYVMVFGWIFTTIAMLATPSHLAELARISGRGWAALAFLGVACSGLAYVGWFDALEHMPAWQVGALLYLEPLVAMIVAAVVIHEGVGVATVVGGAVILLGVWLVNRRVSTAPVGGETEG